MKRFYMTLAMALTLAVASFAQLLPQGASVPYSGIKRNAVNVSKAESNELVTLPETAIVETDWAIDATYYYGEDNVPFVNDNPISVAFDGNDIYFRGMVYTCPNAWIKGKFIDNVASFSSGQYCGTYDAYDVYACGSSDLANFGNILFQYDPEAKTFTLANFYLENIYPDQQGFIFFAYRMVLYKDLQVPAPVDLTVVPDVNKAQVSWTSDAGKFNLRYRKYVDVSGNNRFWDFEDEDQAAEFTFVDADGDGKGWAWINSKVKTHSGNGIMYSMSYDNAIGAMTPDNWIITPKVKLGGQVSFWACSQETDANYANEKFQVYVYAGDEWTSVDEFTAVSDVYTTTVDYQEYTVDLSDYEGLGYIAIRHYDCTDQFWLDIDDMTVTVPDASGIEQPEWIDFGGVPNPYTINNLEPETEYEVQVCAVEEGVSSPWTDRVVFTTLPENPVQGIEELYLVGSFNEWNWQNEEGRVPCTLNENNEFVVTCDFADGDEFKLITPDETNPTGWKWFGGVDEAGVGYFLVTEDLYNVGISLIDGANFKMELGGNYTITVSQSRGLVEPLIMTVKYNDPTAITDVEAAKAQDNTWYNIHGMRLQSVPTVPGIYINGGKKVVIK